MNEQMAGYFMFFQGNLLIFNMNLLDVYTDISYCFEFCEYYCHAAFYFHIYLWFAETLNKNHPIKNSHSVGKIRLAANKY